MQTVESVLRGAAVHTDDHAYVVVQVPLNGITAAAGVVAENADPFNVLIVDKDEVTLILQQSAFEDFQRRLPDCPILSIIYRLVTIDVELEPELTGFLAHISGEFAKANIPILSFGAYSRDHFLVPNERLTDALEIMNKLTS